jgi:hypothetical protein
MRRNRGAVRRSEAGRFALSAILLLSVAQAICESTTNRRQNLDDLISSLCIMHSTRSPVWLKGGVMTTRKLDQYRRQELRKLAGQVQRDAWAVDEQAQVPGGGSPGVDFRKLRCTWGTWEPMFIFRNSTVSCWKMNDICVQRAPRGPATD